MRIFCSSSRVVFIVGSFPDRWVVRRLRREGYQVERIPADGAALKKQIFDRKAYSDFRWTSAEDIASSGGILYAMGAEEYES